MGWGTTFRVVGVLLAVALIALGIWLEVAIADGAIDEPRRGRLAPYFLAAGLLAGALSSAWPASRRSRSDEIMERARRQHGMIRRSPWPAVVSVFALLLFAAGVFLLWP